MPATRNAVAVALAAVAAFAAFTPVTYVWHVHFFPSFYVGPTLSVKSADQLSLGFLLGALAVLMAPMAWLVPRLLTGARNRVRGGAMAGSSIATAAVVFHGLLLNAQFPRLDPLSYYLLDAAWAALAGALAGAVIVAVHDRVSGVRSAEKE